MIQPTSTLGERIAVLRRESGMTQEELALRLNITPQAVSKWERGVGLPDITVLAQLAQALGTTVGTLFGENDEVNQDTPLADRFGNLPLIASRDGLGCYSDKAVRTCTEQGVEFEDGSRVDYDTRTVTNQGAGEIRLVECDAGQYRPLDDLKTSYDVECDPFHGLKVVNSFCCDIALVPSPDGVSRVRAQGSARFISLIRTAVQNDTLMLEIESPQGHTSGERDNHVTVELALERGECLETTINGCGLLSTVIPFVSGRLTVNGTGDIQAGDFEELTTAVNGSGDIRIGNVSGKCELHVNGSGDISAANLGSPVLIAINGSGDVSAKRAADASVRIAGSGDITLTNVTERLSIRISGSGDISCGGEVEHLEIAVSGGGDIDASALTTRTANIQLEGGAETTVGRIVEQSTERIDKSAQLRVTQRG